LRNIIRIALVSLLLLACVPSSTGKTVPEEAPTPDFVLSGDVDFQRAEGWLVLRLSHRSCEEATPRYDDMGNYSLEQSCPPFPRYGWKSARLLAPWGAEFEPVQGGPNGVAFKIDWSRSGIDPLSDGAASKVDDIWRITAPDAAAPLEWRPTSEDVQAMLVLIGDATATQVGVYEVSAPAQVQVLDFKVDDELRAGSSAYVILSVKNQGKGSAYRLIATTRSDVPALHRLQFSFGRLDPGEIKQRRVLVTLPRVNEYSEAVVVVDFHEAHRFTPEPHRAHFAVHRAFDMPSLSLSCRVVGQENEVRPMVDAGDTVKLTCEVRNQGAPARGVRVTAALGGRAGEVSSSAIDVGAERAGTASLLLDVPKDASIDSELSVNLVATSGGADQVTARTQLLLVVARPNLCPGGKLTREQLKAKGAELRRKMDAGLITKAEYDKYYEELVGCLE
jgi:hypothetical protein